MCGSLKSAADLSAADENLSFLLCALVSRNLAPGKGYCVRINSVSLLINTLNHGSFVTN